jgi:hypothetical protein
MGRDCFEGKFGSLRSHGPKYKMFLSGFERLVPETEVTLLTLTADPSHSVSPKASSEKRERCVDCVPNPDYTSRE